jgi:hypothetical protein
MLLIKDGVKYLPYDYTSEEELEQMVIEHYKEIFGKNSLYFDPQTMKTHVGIEARNDGIIIDIEQNKWYILEVELAQHSLRRHIIPQATDFSIAYEQLDTRKKLTETIFNLIRQDPQKTAAFQARKIEDPHKYLTETIDTAPTIAIVIDQRTPELDQVSKKLLFKTRTTEFQTYTRENAPNVHIHLFEPLYEEKLAMPKQLLNILTVLDQVYRRGKTYDEATKIAAKKLNIKEKSIRHDCTTDMGLTSRQFNRIIKDKQRLRKLITEKYPDYTDKIREALT